MEKKATIASLKLTWEQLSDLDALLVSNYNCMI